MGINNTILSYSFEDSNKFFGYDRRINITTMDGTTYNIAAEDNSDRFFLPNCIIKHLWAKVQLPDDFGNQKTFYINRNSLAKRTHAPSYFTEQTLRKHKESKDFDQILTTLSKVDRLAQKMVGSSYFACVRSTNAAQIVKAIEKNRDKYIERVWQSGAGFTIHKGGSCIIVEPNHETQHANFYVQIHTVLGKGGFKTIYSLLDYETEKEDYALSIQKLSNSRPKQIKYSKAGYLWMESLKDSPYIMNARQYIEEGILRNEQDKIISTERNATAYMVMEKYPQTFCDILKSADIPMGIKLELFEKVLSGVTYMHSRGVVHGDLKFQNVLMREKDGDYDLKIADLDFSCTFEERKKKNRIAGTYAYLAPEALTGQCITAPEKLDSWSLGIMLYELCEGDPEFIHGLKRLEPEERIEQIQEGIQNLAFNHLDEESSLKFIIKGLLDLDPEKRMSVFNAQILLRSYLGLNSLIDSFSL